jgi:hypothetical protein
MDDLRIATIRGWLLHEVKVSGKIGRASLDDIFFSTDRSPRNLNSLS